MWYRCGEMEVCGTGVVRLRCVVQAVFPLDKIKGGGGGYDS